MQPSDILDSPMSPPSEKPKRSCFKRALKYALLSPLVLLICCIWVCDTDLVEDFIG